MRKGKIAMAVGLLAVGVLLQACSKPEQYGEALGRGETTALGSVLSKPKSFEGQTVKVKGEIVTECPTGCWFEMKEGSAVLYVEIGQQGLAIPQRVGKEVTVEGTIAVDGANVRLEGKGVEIR